MLIHHDFIHTSIFFRWSLLSLLNRTKGQLKFLPRGEELALERVVEIVVHVKQQITIVTQTVNVADVPAMKGPNVRRPDTVWKQLNARQADIFPYFSSKSKIFIRKCSTLFTILKRFHAAQNFELNTFRHTAIQALQTWELFNDTAGHGPSITPYYSVKYTNFPRKIFYLHLQSSSASRKWTNSNVFRFADHEHRVQRDLSVTLFFSLDTTGDGLRITKRSAVWYFSIFLLEKYQFLLESILSLLRILKRFFRKWKNLNVVLYADSAVYSVSRDPSVTLKKTFLRILPDKIQNTITKL